VTEEPPRILLVDSEDHAPRVLEALGREGVQAQHQRVELRDQLVAALGQPWDLVISDHDLRRLSGLDALAAVCEQCPGLPVVIVSATMDEKTAVELMRAGARDCLTHSSLARLSVIVRREVAEARARRQSESEHHARLSFQRTLLDTIPLPVFYKDAVGRYLGCNVAFERFTGLVRTEIEGRTVTDIAPPEIAREYERMDRELLERRGQQSYAWKVRDATGQVREVVFHKATFESPDGTLAGLIGVVIDTTESRQDEAQLLQADRFASVGTLAAGVAHELNNPLTYLMTRLEQASRTTDPAVAPHILEAMEAAERVRRLVADLHTFAQAEGDEASTLDVVAVVNVAANLARSEIRHRARLVLSLDAVPAVQGNAGRLSQVFLNLLLNAAHAVEQRRSEDNEILVSTRHVDAEVVVEVSDTGRGMSARQLELLFEPFSHPRREGGLGLSIARRVVQKLGGRIEAESEVGQGSRFRVWLPLAAEPACAKPVPEQEPGRRSSDAPAGHGRMLVVDDEPRICIALSRVFSPRFEVVTRESGHAARRLLEQDRNFDVILCDLMMQPGTGSELHGWLAQYAPQLAQRMLFITGGAATQDQREFLKHIGDRKVDKPFNIPRLIQQAEWIAAGGGEP